MISRLVATALLLSMIASVVVAQEDGRRGRRGDRDRGRWGDRDRGGDRGSGGRYGGGPPGRGGFDPIARLDANNNGVIDQSEIDGIPERYRVMMDARGFQLNSGESVDAVRGRMRERFEQERERRDRERREEDDRSPNDNGRANRSTPPAPFKPRDRERITVDLPKAYVDVDSDLDGQIGLYEWIVARRTDLELFDEIDRNTDGLLTPRELVAWDALKADAGKKTLAVNKRERLVIVGGSSTAAGGAADTNGSPGASDRREDSDRDRGRADWTFGRMDRDRDGTISMDEWESSRRIRPWFESAGVKIRPMSAKEFSATYMKLSQSRGDRSRGR